MELSATITRNGSSAQIVIPAELRERYGLHPGGSVTLEARDDGILLKHSTAPFVTFAVSSIGYEGRTLAQFLEELRSHRIRQLIDVREIPLSRKNGFSKVSLGAALGDAGILYRHIPELGSPRELRHAYRAGGSTSEFMDGYTSHLDRNTDAFEMLRDFALGVPSAIMCFERDYRGCHRRILSDRLSKEGFSLTHL
jgi:AbrB family looped-hinge helix DNA binding protein